MLDIDANCHKFRIPSVSVSAFHSWPWEWDGVCIKFKTVVHVALCHFLDLAYVPTSGDVHVGSFGYKD